MRSDLIIYSDESGEQGPLRSNFYGGALVRGSDFDEVVEILQAKKDELNLFSEVKWTKVSAQYLQKYVDLCETFFDLVQADKIKVRVMFTDNRYVIPNYSREHKDQKYTKLYYQFVKHAFGLRYFEESAEGARILLRLDQLPVSRKKRLVFKEYLAALSKDPDFRKARLIVPLEEIRESDSKKEVVLQMLDIVLGSMYFRLNDFHKVVPAGRTRRASKTRAKEKLYKCISHRVREIYPGFNISITTGRQTSADFWNHRYRHWVFVPYESELMGRRGKK